MIHFVRSLTGLAILCSVQAQVIAAAPPNDNFANRIPLSGEVVVTTGSNVDATREAGEPFHWSSTGGASVWWTWVAPNNGLVTMTTAGSSYDTLLAVYTGNAVSSLTLIANNDDYNNVQSFVEFQATAGTTYQIAVDGFGSSTGTIRLNITNLTTTAMNLVPFGSVWKYLDNGSDQGTAWVLPSFNDNAWASGPAQLGYGDGDEATVVSFGPNANSRYPTTYFRRSFVVEDPTLALSLNLSLIFDDGGIVYLNGQEVMRTRTMPVSGVSYLTYCGLSDENELATASVPVGLLVPGVNVLAVEVHQTSGNSSDLSFDLQLAGTFDAATNRGPIVSITSPAEGTIFGTPASFAISATAMDRETTVTNVDFYANSTRLTRDTTSPYSFQWNSVPAGDYALRVVGFDDTGLFTTSAPVNITVSANTAAPTVTSKVPAPGTVTDLTSITVTFSKPVLGVDASDLRINGTPATGLSGGGTTYTFTFAQPAYGTVSISWAAGHGINDGFTPANAFNAGGAGATWQYTLNDAVPPAVSAITPSSGSTVAALTSIQVTFTEPVTGVNASDLLINATPASGVSGSGAGPYSFTFAQPPNGTVLVAWTSSPGIQDVAGNPLTRSPWSYVLDTNASGVVISEIMYHPSSESPRDEYIELYNKGAATVNLSGWRFSSGVQFTFPTNTTIAPGAYLVIAADRQAFMARYPGVANVIGDWIVVRTTNVLGTVLTSYENQLSNTRNDIDLDDATGRRVDSVEYADEGDWAIRQRGLNDGGFRGWTWKKDHDGLGRSLELINSGMPNEFGQNWGSSAVINGTPGAANSIAANDVAPFILDVRHFPIVPRSTEPVSVSARIMDETGSGMTVALHWRVDSVSPPPFTVATMFDDGLHGDGAAGDGLYGAVLPALPNNTVVEFYVRAVDAQSRERTWPGAAVSAEDQGASPIGQVANALFQVDDSTYANPEPLYKVIMTASEYNELGSLFNSSPNSDAMMNATFISIDGTETLLRYRVGVRNRGHGSRFGNPHNYRVEFPSDNDWKGIVDLNFNARTVHAQHFGSVLLQKSGAVGGNSRVARLRVNNNAGPGGTPTYGVYAINEPVDGEWSENHFPNDGDGNVYKVIRDINPPEFDYRTTSAYPGLFGPEDPRSYQNTYFKESNGGLNEWSDLIGMLRVMGPNGTTEFTLENMRRVINVEQWLTHLAAMNLVNNRETGLNTGYNDDYYLYRGVKDPRFILAYHDLDTIINEGDSSGSTTTTIFSSTAGNGAGAALNRFLRHPEVEPLYYATLQRLIDTTFAPQNFDPLIEQTLGGYVPVNVITRMKNWNAARVAFVRGAIAGLVPPSANLAVVTGEPRSPTPFNTATLTVSGQNIVAYRYSLNNLPYSAETPVSTPISLTGLANGSTNRVSVIGRNSAGAWQSAVTPTVSRPWVVNTAWPRVRINEVLARNTAAVNHNGSFPDVIELYNEGNSSIDLSGMRLTDNSSEPGKYTFPAGTALAAGAYLVLYANNPDGSPGIHLGFSLDQNGEGVFLFDRTASGGGLLDSVEFGPQIANLSFGRLNGGTWQLTQPTLGSANTAALTDNAAAIKINEWLAAAQPPFPEDFIELYNPGVLPVDLGGLYLTDNAIGNPRAHTITPLSFIPAKGYLVFTADGGSSGSVDVNFQLSSEQGEIALVGTDNTPIDCVYYGPQRGGITMGRCPDGGSNIVSLVTPTPGGANLCPATPPAPVTVPLVAYDHTWRYNQTADLSGVNWTATGYNDGSWPSGQGVLARAGSGSISQPVRTSLTLGRLTYYFRTTFTVPSGANYTGLQISHFIDDGAIVYLNGQEAYRYNMPSGGVDYTTPSASGISGAPLEQGPITFPITNLLPGNNTLAVEVHQSDPGSSDVYMGFKLDAIIVTNPPSAAGIVINEVLADNASVVEAGAGTPDWLELYNPSQSPVDLSDLSLSDKTATPRRWVFPAGTFISAQGYYTIRLNADLPPSETNTGFGLKASGDSIYLFDRPSRGGGVLDFVSFGLQVPDLSIGRVPNGGTNWVLTLPTLGAANIAAPLGDPALLKINEWLANPVPGKDDWFEVYNPNSQPVAIGRFYFTDVLNETMRYAPLPALSFVGSGSNAWLRIWADDNATAGADHVAFSLRANGEAVGIANASGALIDGISFTAQQEGVSEGRLPDGAATTVRFHSTASPGNPNYLPLASVVVNEILTHTDLPLEDAVELRNLTAAPVDISGWYLSDARSNLRKYTIPAGIVIPANGFKVFYEHQFNNPDAGVPFSFSSSGGDNVYLSQSVGGQLTGYRAEADFGPAENGVSFGRYVNSAGTVTYPAMSALSLGTGVTAQSPTNQITTFRTGQGAANPYPKVGPVVLNEIMYFPPLLGTNENTRDQFVELKNVGNVSVPLFDPNFPTNRWRLRGGVDFDFPPNLNLAPQGTLVVVSFDPATNAAALSAFRTAYGITNAVTILGPWSGRLARNGEEVELKKPDMPQPGGSVPYVLVERVDYLAVAPWPTNATGTGRSIQRVSGTGYANDPTNWVAAFPTFEAGAASPTDTDGDGMPDAWENTYGFNPNNAADATQDADGDGMTNRDEYLAGTHPLNSSSRLALAISFTPSNAARLQFDAAPNVGYSVQYRDVLTSGNWTHLTSISAAPNNRTVVLTNPVPASTRFFRVTTP